MSTESLLYSQRSKIVICVYLTDCDLDVCGSTHCPQKYYDTATVTKKEGGLVCKCLVCVKKPTTVPPAW